MCSNKEWKSWLELGKELWGKTWGVIIFYDRYGRVDSDSGLLFNPLDNCFSVTRMGVGNVEWGHFGRQQKTQQQKRRIMDGRHRESWDLSTSRFWIGSNWELRSSICHRTRGIWSGVRHTDFKILLWRKLKKEKERGSFYDGLGLLNCLKGVRIMYKFWKIKLLSKLL